MPNEIIQLRFRAIDRNIFLAIKNGRKKVETRAASPKFAGIKTGTVLRLVCGKNKLEKKVKKVEVFKSIAALLKKYRPEEINPAIKTAQELEKMWHSFPGYRQKIKKHGLVAMEL